jgi:peptidyl-prolyl cis-trans isomerase SurA
MKYKDYVGDMVIDYEDRHLEEKYKEFRLLINEYSDGILLFDLMDEVVWSKAVTDTAGYQAYFNQNREKYRWGKRVDASVFTILDETVFDTLSVMVNNGVSDEDILKAINNDSLELVKYEKNIFSKGDMKEIDAAKWKAGSTSAVFNDNGKPIYYIRINEKLNPANKELDECRGMVISDYQTQLEDEWVAQLKVKYPVVIDKEVLIDLKKNGLTE